MGMVINWCHSDHYVYFKRLDDDSYIILCLYVDDILVARSNMDHIKGMKCQLAHAFAMKDLAETKKYIGMKICRVRKNTKLTFIKLIILRRCYNILYGESQSC